jgi:uncharacterized circularly permuted ATP-grasp superfamily protein
MADVYGPRALVRAGLLPTALVRGHPGYLRSMHGVEPVGETFLHIVAFDLARGPDGQLVGGLAANPSPLGPGLPPGKPAVHLAPVSRRHSRPCHVQRLAGTYRALIDGIKAMSPAGADSPILRC